MNDCGQSTEITAKLRTITNVGLRFIMASTTNVLRAPLIIRYPGGMPENHRVNQHKDPGADDSGAKPVSVSMMSSEGRSLLPMAR